MHVVAAKIGPFVLTRRRVHFCAQAVVNERVDYKSLHADLVAALEGQDQKSVLLERSLLAKESELESMHVLLRVRACGEVAAENGGGGCGAGSGLSRIGDGEGFY